MEQEKRPASVLVEGRVVEDRWPVTGGWGTGGHVGTLRAADFINAGRGGQLGGRELEFANWHADL